MQQNVFLFTGIFNNQFFLEIRQDANQQRRVDFVQLKDDFVVAVAQRGFGHVIIAVDHAIDEACERRLQHVGTPIDEVLRELVCDGRVLFVRRGERLEQNVEHLLRNVFRLLDARHHDVENVREHRVGVRRADHAEKVVEELKHKPFVEIDEQNERLDRRESLEQVERALERLRARARTAALASSCWRRASNIGTDRRFGFVQRAQLVNEERKDARLCREPNTEAPRESGRQQQTGAQVASSSGAPGWRRRRARRARRCAQCRRGSTRQATARRAAPSRPARPPSARQPAADFRERRLARK